MVPRFDALEAMEFGRAVCACRLRGSETQAQLAARCSPAITEHRLSRLEHGRVLIRAVDAPRCCGRCPASRRNSTA